MKLQYQLTRIDEERLKAALNSSGSLTLTKQPIRRAQNSALVNSILTSIEGKVWIFNMDYDPKVEGHKTKSPVVIADDLEDLFLEIVEQIGAEAEKVGEHY